MTYCSAHRLFVNVIDHVDSFNENKSTNELDFNFRLVYQCDLPQIIPSSGKSKDLFWFWEVLILSSSNHSEY